MSVIASIALGIVLAASPKADSVPESSYTVDASGTTTSVKAGKDGVFKLSIKPAKGYKVSREAPMKIKLKSDGVKLAKAKLGQKDAKDAEHKSVKFKVDFAAATAGKQSIECDATFFVCSDKICEKKKEKLTVAVNVE